MLEAIFCHIWSAFILTVQILFILLFPGLLLGGLLQLFSNRLRAKVARSIGVNTFVYFTFPGVVIHELGHALFCLIFRHKIVDMKLFSPEDDGTLGYVNHRYNPASYYQTAGLFFIGTGPIWLGGCTIFILSKILLPEASLHLNFAQGKLDPSIVNIVYAGWDIIIASFKSTAIFFSPSVWSSLEMYIWLYFIFAIGSHITLSPPDMSGAYTGLVTLVGLIFMINIFTVWINPPPLLWFQNHLFPYVTMIYGVLLFTVLIIILLNILSSLFFTCFRTGKE